MKIIRNFALYATVVLTANSCAPIFFDPDPYIVNTDRQKENFYYTPPAQNILLLTSKNDLKISFEASTGDRQTGINLHTAFMPGKNMGLMFNMGGYKDDQGNLVKLNHTELGLGYTKQISSSFRAETYGGTGFGRIKNTHHTGNSEIRTNYFFFQPVIALQKEKGYSHIGLSSRIAFTHFSIKDTAFDGSREPIVAEQFTGLINQPTHVIWEPGIVMQAGWKNFLFHGSYFVSKDLTNKDLIRAGNVFSFGLVLRLNTTQKKPKEEEEK
jgi:hypothetical protein